MMLKSLLFAISLVLSADGAKRQMQANDGGIDFGGRIIGGRPADQKDFPFIVSIQKEKDLNWCGGIIIDEYWVLTACHCIMNVYNKTYYDVDSILAIGGQTSLKDSNRQKLLAKRLIAHESCKVKKGDHFFFDVGLIELTYPFRFNSRLQPLSWKGDSDHDVEKILADTRRLQKKNAKCQTPGWFSTQMQPAESSSTDLKVADVIMHTGKECDEICANHQKEKCYDLENEKQMCVTSKDASGCRGDSGSPLICNGKVLGILSQVSKTCDIDGMQIYTDAESIAHAIRLMKKYPREVLPIGGQRPWKKPSS